MFIDFSSHLHNVFVVFDILSFFLVHSSILSSSSLTSSSSSDILLFMSSSRLRHLQRRLFLPPSFLPPPRPIVVTSRLFVSSRLRRLDVLPFIVVHPHLRSSSTRRHLPILPLHRHHRIVVIFNVILFFASFPLPSYRTSCLFNVALFRPRLLLHQFVVQRRHPHLLPLLSSSSSTSSSSIHIFLFHRHIDFLLISTSSSSSHIVFFIVVIHIFRIFNVFVCPSTSSSHRPSHHILVSLNFVVNLPNLLSSSYRHRLSSSTSSLLRTFLFLSSSSTSSSFHVVLFLHVSSSHVFNVVIPHLLTLFSRFFTFVIFIHIFSSSSSSDFLSSFKTSSSSSNFSSHRSYPHLRFIFNGSSSSRRSSSSSRHHIFVI
ncbi:hypothetical protein BV898_18393 [Hypsibius exemplaris]|uniref:Uncharacterized protein n=1 Tax=Hypsibius exemplaris TaxID=2072580 RepID=A0A9X6NGU1_HYPEX|nr:hypothetical protein BV898_18393 [Hypsibius exemplaris]